MERLLSVSTEPTDMSASPSQRGRLHDLSVGGVLPEVWLLAWAAVAHLRRDKIARFLT